MNYCLKEVPLYSVQCTPHHWGYLNLMFFTILQIISRVLWRCCFLLRVVLLATDSVASSVVMGCYMQSTTAFFCCLQSLQNAVARLMTTFLQFETTALLPTEAMQLSTDLSSSRCCRAFADVCQLVIDSECCPLQSADVNTCSVPQTCTELGDRSFSMEGPQVWNSLPVSPWQPNIEFGQLKWLLKTFLFVWDCSTFMTLWF